MNRTCKHVYVGMEKVLCSKPMNRNLPKTNRVACVPCEDSDHLWHPPSLISPVGQHTFVTPSAVSRRAVVSYWRKYVHEVLVNRLGGLSLPRKSVVRLTDRPDMTLDVYRGRKTTIQPTNQSDQSSLSTFNYLFLALSRH